MQFFVVILVPDINYLIIKFTCPYSCRPIIQTDTDSTLNLLDKRGCWKLKEAALNRNLWRTRFGKGYGPIIEHTAN
jgi:hypothetical protein